MRRLKNVFKIILTKMRRLISLANAMCRTDQSESVSVAMDQSDRGGYFEN